MNKDMKKRAAEALGIIALIAAAFAVLNFVMGGIMGSTVMIDGQYYNSGERELTLILSTVEGTDRLAEFTRLEKLTLTPYKKAIVNSLEAENSEQLAAWEREAEYTFDGYTDLEDISFVSELTWLKELDISYCAVSDIAFLENFHGLTYLDISHTNVEDIQVLGKVSRLQTLCIRETAVTELSALLELNELEVLYADKTADSEIIAQLEEKGVNVILS